MKRILAFILLAVFAATAFSQVPNAKLSQLEDYLRQQGFNVSHVQASGNPGILQHHWHTYIHSFTSKMDPEQSISKKQEEDALDSIRSTFSQLGKLASESYVHEYHKNNTDTIKCAIAFSSQNISDVLYLVSHRSQRQKYFDKEIETADFFYTKKRNVLTPGGNYNHCYFVIDSTLLDVERKDFEIAALEAHLQPVLKSAMKLKGANSYPILWQHDERFNDEVGQEGGLIQKNTSGRNRSGMGLVTGTHYFIPAEYEKEATAFYRQLDSLTYDYVCHHPEQCYNYFFDKKIREGELDYIIYGNSNDPMHSSRLGTMQDEDGFHFVFLSIKGDLWVPSNWPMLKSYINGEKTYRDNLHL